MCVSVIYMTFYIIGLQSSFHWTQKVIKVVFLTYWTIKKRMKKISLFKGRELSKFRDVFQIVVYVTFRT